mgnify:FL=1
MKTTTKKTTRKRTVFGRRFKTFDGITYRFELTNEGLRIRQKHARSAKTINLDDLLSGKKSATVEGKVYTFELEKDGVIMHQPDTRVTAMLSWAEIVDTTSGQKRLL